MLKHSLITLSLVSLVACNGGGGGGGGSSSGGGRLGSHQAQFIDAPTEGLQYYQGSESWEYRTTEANGVFYCNPGSQVTFSLRAGYNADLGSVTCGAEVVFPRDLDGVGAEVPKYLALLLHHMDTSFDGQDYNFSTTNGKIVIAKENINLLAEANLDFDPSNVNSIMGTINELRGIRCLKQYVHWPLTSGEDRGLLETQCKIDNPEWRTLADAELTQAIADMDTHLTTSELIYGKAESGDTATVVSVSELRSDVIASFNNEYTLISGDSNEYTTNWKCALYNASGLESVVIGGKEYVSQSGASYQLNACTVISNDHPSLSAAGTVFVSGGIVQVSGQDIPSEAEVLSGTSAVRTTDLKKGKFFIKDNQYSFGYSCEANSDDAFLMSSCNL